MKDRLPHPAWRVVELGVPGVFDLLDGLHGEALCGEQRLEFLARVVLGGHPFEVHDAVLDALRVARWEALRMARVVPVAQVPLRVAEGGQQGAVQRRHHQQQMAAALHTARGG
jgi:hypothetical protein